MIRATPEINTGKRDFRSEDKIVDRFFEKYNLEDFINTSNAFPLIDVIETEKALIARAEVPGMKRDEIRVTVSDRTLNIGGKKRYDKLGIREGYHVIESHNGSFCRSLNVPKGFNIEKIETSHKDGVLKIIIPK